MDNRLDEILISSASLASHRPSGDESTMWCHVSYWPAGVQDRKPPTGRRLSSFGRLPDQIEQYRIDIAAIHPIYCHKPFSGCNSQNMVYGDGRFGQCLPLRVGPPEGYEPANESGRHTVRVQLITAFLSTASFEFSLVQSKCAADHHKCRYGWA